MEMPGTPNLPESERQLPAWAFSLVFHAATLALLAYFIHGVPTGAAEEPSRGAGIVLKRSTDEGDLYEGEQQTDNTADDETTLTADELVASLPSETNAARWTDDLPQLPAIGPGASGGTPNAGEFATSAARTGAPSGGDARVQVFGVEGVGSKFVYVFDRSSSMDGAPLAAAKRQLIESLASLESVHQFHIIFFNHEQQQFEVPGGSPRIAFATDRNKQLAANFVGGVTADGGTDRFAALSRAVALQPDVIFFLTDVDDPMPARELAEIARLNRRARAMICTIEFGRGPRRDRQNFLVDLAKQSGGNYGYVDARRLSH